MRSHAAAGKALYVIREWGTTRRKKKKGNDSAPLKEEIYYLCWGRACRSLFRAYFSSIFLSADTTRILDAKKKHTQLKEVVTSRLKTKKKNTNNGILSRCEESERRRVF